MQTTTRPALNLTPAPLELESDWSRIDELAAGFFATTRNLDIHDATVAAVLWGRCPDLVLRALTVVSETGAAFNAAFVAVKEATL